MNGQRQRQGARNAIDSNLNGWDRDREKKMLLIKIFITGKQTETETENKKCYGLELCIVNGLRQRSRPKSVMDWNLVLTGLRQRQRAINAIDLNCVLRSEQNGTETETKKCFQFESCIEKVLRY